MGAWLDVIDPCRQLAPDTLCMVQLPSTSVVCDVHDDDADLGAHNRHSCVQWVQPHGHATLLRQRVGGKLMYKSVRWVITQGGVAIHMLDMVGN